MMGKWTLDDNGSIILGVTDIITPIEGDLHSIYNSMATGLPRQPTLLQVVACLLFSIIQVLIYFMLFLPHPFIFVTQKPMTEWNFTWMAI